MRYLVEKQVESIEWVGELMEAEVEPEIVYQQ